MAVGDCFFGGGGRCASCQEGLCCKQQGMDRVTAESYVDRVAPSHLL
jgi:hypothetical protein